MREYVSNAVALARKHGGIIHNQELKKQIASDLSIEDFSGQYKWRVANEPLKDEPMVDGNILVPIAATRHWYYNPSIRILMIWVDETLRRHDREVRRVLEALALPRYRDKEQAKKIVPYLKELRKQIDRTIKAIEG